MTVVDTEQYSCGDCDFVVFDPSRTPFIKFPAVPGSRYKIVPVECTYGVVEVKTNLTLGLPPSKKSKSKSNTSKTGGTLVDACKKLFAYKELTRPPLLVQEVVHRADGVPLLCCNKPFTYAFFYKADFDLKEEKNQHLLLEEFYAINATVEPEMRVNGLFVLDTCSILWVKDGGTFAYSPEESIDNHVSLVQSKEDTLYLMYVHLSNMLRITSLQAPIFNNDYGGSKYLKSLPAISNERSKK